MNIDDIYKSSSNFLKASDLIVNGVAQKPVIEIETAEVRENTYNGETKQQIVLTFVGKDKILGLNVTNARRIAQLTGTTDFSQWPGYCIRLFVDQTELDGKTVDCIRIFPDLPEQTNEKAKAAAASQYTDDVPF